jgi:hypothetical protein
MKSSLTFALFLLFLNPVFAQKSSIPESDLKDQLFSELRRNHSPLGYREARIKLLGYMAIKGAQNSYFVTDVYCEADYSSPGIGRVPNNNIINVEHTWPQSKFGGSDRGFQKSDLHHLYPADSQLNSIRGNQPFGDVIDQTQNTKCPVCSVGLNQNGRRVFEPPQDHKGNVARALFYFSVRYRMPISDDEETALKRWHQEDPVDSEELLRNEQVESYQGNRNPFIDEPQLVQLISNF